MAVKNSTNRRLARSPSWAMTTGKVWTLAIRSPVGTAGSFCIVSSIEQRYIMSFIVRYFFLSFSIGNSVEKIPQDSRFDPIPESSPNPRTIKAQYTWHRIEPCAVLDLSVPAVPHNAEDSCFFSQRGSDSSFAPAFPGNACGGLIPALSRFG